MVNHKLYASQASATPPHFLDNLHFAHFDKHVNHKRMLTRLSKCAKGRLSKKWGGVAHAWHNRDLFLAKKYRTDSVQRKSEYINATSS